MARKFVQQRREGEVERKRVDKKFLRWWASQIWKNIDIGNRSGYKSHPKDDPIQFSVSPLLLLSDSPKAPRVRMLLRVPSPVIPGLLLARGLGLRVWNLRARFAICWIVTFTKLLNESVKKLLIANGNQVSKA